MARVGEESVRSRLPAASPLVGRCLGRRAYEPVWAEMRRFTEARGPSDPDEVWLVEHDPVFTQGQAGRPEHLLTPSDIPVVQSDRGGQITYHGPGQLVAYVLVDLKRRGIGVRTLVDRLEQVVIELLAGSGVAAQRRAGAPGVYVADRKVAALGLRVRHGCSFQGMAVNVDMDLAPFEFINPCGFEGLQVTDLRRLGLDWSLEETGRRWLSGFAAQLGTEAQLSE